MSAPQHPDDHDQALHDIVESTKEQGIWDIVTKTAKPMTVSYRADGCVTFEEKAGG